MRAPDTTASHSASSVAWARPVPAHFETGVPQLRGIAVFDQLHDLPHPRGAAIERLLADTASSVHWTSLDSEQALLGGEGPRVDLAVDLVLTPSNLDKSTVGKQRTRLLPHELAHLDPSHGTLESKQHPYAAAVAPFARFDLREVDAVPVGGVGERAHPCAETNLDVGRVGSGTS